MEIYKNMKSEKTYQNEGKNIEIIKVQKNTVCPGSSDPT